MVNRTTVNVSLTPELETFVRGCVTSGRYQTASEVIREGLRLLERQEREREEIFQSLKANLERGIIEAEPDTQRKESNLLEELRELVDERRRRRKALAAQ